MRVRIVANASVLAEAQEADLLTDSDFEDDVEMKLDAPDVEADSEDEDSDDDEELPDIKSLVTEKNGTGPPKKKRRT